MTLTYIIRETLLMMGFTFVVGAAFAYVLKLMTLFFSYLNGEDLPSLVRRSRIWGGPTAWKSRTPTVTCVPSWGAAVRCAECRWIPPRKMRRFTA